MKKSIIVGGNLIVDFCKDIDVYPEHSKLTTIRNINRSLGGLLCNCGIDLAKIDPALSVHAVGRVGGDDAGKYILSEMGKYENISLESVKITEGVSSGFTDVMFDTTNKTRTFFTCRGANDYLCREDFDFDSLDASILHVGYILLLAALDEKDGEYKTKMARLLHDAQKKGIMTSVDVVSEESDRFEALVPPALRYCDFCIINETEAGRICGISPTGEDGKISEKNIERILRSLREMGVSKWAVVHSRDFSFGLDEDGNFTVLPSIDIPRKDIKDTTGAGDAFASGILYSALRGDGLMDAMRFATVTATCSITAFGGTAGVGSYQEMTARFPL